MRLVFTIALNPAVGLSSAWTRTRRQPHRNPGGPTSIRDTQFADEDRSDVVVLHTHIHRPDMGRRRLDCSGDCLPAGYAV